MYCIFSFLTTFTTYLRVCIGCVLVRTKKKCDSCRKSHFFKSNISGLLKAGRGWTSNAIILEPAASSTGTINTYSSYLEALAAFTTSSTPGKASSINSLANAKGVSD